MIHALKKLFCLFLCFTLLIPFAACNTNEGCNALGQLNTDYSCCCKNHSAPDGDIIVLQLNSLALFALNERIMPSLTSFAEQSFSHKSFYAQRGVSEGIYSALTSLYAPINGIDTAASYYSLAHLLKDNGYNLSAFSAESDFELIESLGFDAPNTNANPKSVLEAALSLADNEEKDFVFACINAISDPYIADGEGNAKLEGNGSLNSYLNCAGYADKLLESFLSLVSENTTVVIYGTAPTLGKSFSRYGKEHKDLFPNGFSYDSAFQVPLIIRGAKTHPVKTAFEFATIYDVYPTLAGYLNLKSDKMLICGDNIICGKQRETPRFFALQGYYSRGNYITNEIYYLKTNKVASIYDKSTMEQLITKEYNGLEKIVLDTINESEYAVKSGYFADTISLKQLYSTLPSTDMLVLKIEANNDVGNLVSYKAYLANNARTYPADALGGVWNGACRKDNAVTLEAGTEAGSLITEELSTLLFDRLYICPAVIGGKLEVYASSKGENDTYSSWKLVCSFSPEGTYGDGVFLPAKTSESVRIKLVLTRIGGVAPMISSITISPCITEADSEELPLIYEPFLEAVEVFAPDKYKTKAFSGLLAIDAIVVKATNKAANIEDVISMCCDRASSKICDTSSAALAYFASSFGLNAYVDEYSVNDLARTLSAPQPVICKTNSGYILAIGCDESNIIAILPENGEQLQIPFTEYKTTEVIVVDSNLYSPKIIESIIPENSCIRPGEVVEQKKYIIIHNTGNYNPGATAASHAAYLHSQTNVPDRQASWHYTVDDKEIYHHIPDNENAWHASDGTYGEGNYYGIGIEVCVNNFPGKYEGEEYEAFLQQFMRTIKNTSYLVAKLMIENNIGMDGVKQHYDFAPDKKNCPMQMRYTSASGSFTRDNGDMWIYLLSEIKKQYNSMKGTD